MATRPDKAGSAELRADKPWRELHMSPDASSRAGGSLVGGVHMFLSNTDDGRNITLLVRPAKENTMRYLDQLTS